MIGHPSAPGSSNAALCEPVAPSPVAGARGGWLGAVQECVRDARRPLLWYAASRLLILVVGVTAFAIRPDYGVRHFFRMWDAKWYTLIARDGYPAVIPDGIGEAGRSPIAFFPLFPLLVRAVTWALPVSEAIAGMLVSLLFGAISVVLLHKLARILRDDETADRAAALFCVFPGSVVLSVAFSEGLMIALAIACSLALLSRRWLVAGCFAGLATAVRPNAVALAAACAWQSAVALRRREWRSVIAPLLAPVGMLAYLGFLWVRTGIPDAWFRVERNGWNQRFDFGRRALEIVTDFLRDPLGHPVRLVVVLCVVFLVGTVALQLRSGFPGFLNVYSLVLAAMALTSSYDIVRMRAILTTFPVFIALATVTKRPAVFRLLIEALVIATILELIFPTWGSP